MTKAAIYGYGNIGRGVELALSQAPDMQLVGIFTRRDPQTISPLTGAAVYSADSLDEFVGKLDVVILCGGSATDLPVLTPTLAKKFCVVDSFDTHARIPEQFAAVDAAAREGDTFALISGGWDPGLFSVNRVYADAVLPRGTTYTFWGRGVSQGHSDAIRRLPGVLDARQYTVPVPEALAAVRAGETPELTTRQKHTRECYVVAEENADLAEIERQIKEMPAYFADYDTTVTFISPEEMGRCHSELPHGGSVLRSGTTGLTDEHRSTIEFSLKLDSNPEFTASVLVALARAAVRMFGRGRRGAGTILDVAPGDLSVYAPDELRAQML